MCLEEIWRYIIQFGNTLKFYILNISDTRVDCLWRILCYFEKGIPFYLALHLEKFETPPQKYRFILIHPSLSKARIDVTFILEFISRVIWESSPSQNSYNFISSTVCHLPF